MSILKLISTTNHYSEYKLVATTDISEITKTAVANLPTKYGMFQMTVYKTPDGMEHVALLKGKPQKPMLTRVHSSCLTGDAFFSLKCDCGPQLEESMKKIQEDGNGLIL